MVGGVALDGQHDDLSGLLACLFTGLFDDATGLFRRVMLDVRDEALPQFFLRFGRRQPRDMFELAQLLLQHVLGAHFDGGDLLLDLRHALLLATQLSVASVQHLGASFQAVFTLAEALLKALQLLATFLGFLFKLCFGAIPMLLSLQESLLAFVLGLLFGNVQEALCLCLHRAQFTLDAHFPQQISTQKAPASQSKRASHHEDQGCVQGRSHLPPPPIAVCEPGHRCLTCCREGCTPDDTPLGHDRIEPDIMGLTR
jgi:hypothetical protein